jgi:superfamily II DNA or RNA helicase
LLNQLGLGAHNSVLYTLDNGVRDGIIVPYKLKVVSVPMDGINKRVEVRMKNGKSFMTTEVKNYEYLTKRVEELSDAYDLARLLKSDVNRKKDDLKFARLNRMRGVYNFPSKQLGAQYLLSIIPPDLRLIGFCGSIAQCNALFKKRFHSKTTDIDYKDFVAGKFNRLGTVDAANMGININDLEVGLIVQVQSKFIKLVQRSGRLFRKDPANPDKLGLLIVTVSRNSVDEEWADKAITDNIDPKRVTYLNLEDIIADKSLLFQ